MIFIARNHQGKIVSIVSAADEKAVRAYYQGKGVNYDTLTPFPIDKDRENEKMGYVTPILDTEQTTALDIRWNYKDSAPLILIK